MSKPVAPVTTDSRGLPDYAAHIDEILENYQATSMLESVDAAKTDAKAAVLYLLEFANLYELNKAWDIAEPLQTQKNIINAVGGLKAKLEGRK